MKCAHPPRVSRHVCLMPTVRFMVVIVIQALISRWEIANVNLFTTTRRRRPGAVHQSVCPGVQVSTQHGTWTPVGTLPTCVRRSSSPSPTLSWSWWTGLPRVNLSSTGDGRLPTPVLHPGTRCLTISRTLILPFNLSNVILRHSSFSHISTPQRVWDFL